LALGFEIRSNNFFHDNNGNKLVFGKDWYILATVHADNGRIGQGVNESILI
jgi:hypothetical protein